MTINMSFCKVTIIKMFLFSLCFRTCLKENLETKHYRCRISNTDTFFSNPKQVVFFLHSKSKSKIQFDDEAKTILEPGDAVSFFTNNITAKCTGDDCETSIWQTNYDKDGAFLVSDYAGAYYEANDVYFEERYVSFFDFGPYTKLEMGNLFHPKSYGMSMFISNATGVYEESIYTNKTYDTDSPGILQISSAEFIKVNFNVKAGSTITVPSEFGHANGIIPIKYVGKKKSNLDKKDIVCSPSKQSDTWIYLSYAMMGLTIFLFLLCIIFTIILFFMDTTKKNTVQDSTQQNLLE